jgi:MinD-like ATPase involved in chromosome partitioning or flagellar assembly
MSGVLRLADQIVVVSSPSVDGARSASATLDWLEAHDCGDLVRNGVVVLSVIRPKTKSAVDLDLLERHFAARCRAVVRIPYDPHLEEGAEVDLELLAAETADAYLALAAVVGDGLASPRAVTRRAGGSAAEEDGGPAAVLFPTARRAAEREVPNGPTEPVTRDRQRQGTSGPQPEGPGS